MIHLLGLLLIVTAISGSVVYLVYQQVTGELSRDVKDWQINDLWEEVRR